MTRREEIWLQIEALRDQIWDLEQQADQLDDELEDLDDIGAKGLDDDYFREIGTESDYPIDDDGVN